MRFHMFLSVLLGAGLQVLGAEHLPPLAATVTTEQRQVTADGLTKQVRFQERFIRAEDRVWLERVIPKRAPAPEDAHGHRHLDLEVAARLVHRDAEGGMHLTFVHAGERTLVVAEPRDYPEVGFNDSWAVVSQLADPGLLATMKPLARRSPYLGAAWFELHTGRGFVRVLWSSRLKIALSVESGSTDGQRFHRTTVTLAPLPKALPWQGLEGYTQKEYTDLLD